MTMLKDLNLRALNSATKYPSIPTYHRLGDKGRLQEDVLTPFPLDPETEYEITEKIDGTNARIILATESDEYIIGSREELLTHSSDVIYNPSQGIVDALGKHALGQLGRRAYDEAKWRSDVVVLYGEVYGGKINAAKNYTQTASFGFRVFDVAFFDKADFARSPEDLARWRDAGGQQFAVSRDRRTWCKEFELEHVPTIGHVHDVPTSLPATWEWLATKILTASTAAALDGQPGKPEGIVIRTSDRKRIAKLRVEDYTRTLGKR
jgi:hypothetical protein